MSTKEDIADLQKQEIDALAAIFGELFKLHVTPFDYDKKGHKKKQRDPYEFTIKLVPHLGGWLAIGFAFFPSSAYFPCLLVRFRSL
jgi:hypothetical protein